MINDFLSSKVGLDEFTEKFKKLNCNFFGILIEIIRVIYLI